MLSTDIPVHEGGEGVGLAYTPLPVIFTVSVPIHLLLLLPPSLHALLTVAMLYICPHLPRMTVIFQPRWNAFSLSTSVYVQT